MREPRHDRRMTRYIIQKGLDFVLRGRLCRGYCFSTHACIRSDDMGIALLSQTAYLRRSPLIFFIPLPPSNLRPFGAPPSIGRRERPREPLPLEGAAERSEAGLASFWGGARVLVYRLLETISHSLSYRHCPIRLASLAAFPSRERLCPSLSVSPHILVFALTI